MFKKVFQLKNHLPRILFKTMKNPTTLLSLLLLYPAFIFGQNDASKNDTIPYGTIINAPEASKRMRFYGNTRLTLNQAHFENWVSGGESSLTALLGLDYHFNYSSRKGLVWDTNIEVSIGTTNVSGSTFNKKADDRFEINSLVGQQINRYWNYSGFIKFKTQLLPGYRYFKEDGKDQREKNSRIFSPAIAQAGLGWYFKKSDDLNITLSPVTARVILVGKSFTQNLKEGEKYFGIDAGKTSKMFFGASFSGYYKTKLMEGITVENKFNFYINYLEKIQNIDFDWDANFRFKVNEKISSSLIIHLIYDDDLIKKLQLRELFGVGINIDM